MMGQVVWFLLLAFLATVYSNAHKAKIAKLFDQIRPTNDVISLSDIEWERVKRDGVNWVHGVMVEDARKRKRRDVESNNEILTGKISISKDNGFEKIGAGMTNFVRQKVGVNANQDLTGNVVRDAGRKRNTEICSSKSLGHI